MRPEKGRQDGLFWPCISFHEGWGAVGDSEQGSDGIRFTWRGSLRLKKACGGQGRSRKTSWEAMGSR